MCFYKPNNYFNVLCDGAMVGGQKYMTYEVFNPTQVLVFHYTWLEFSFAS